RRRSSCSHATTSRSLTAPARTPTSAAASPRSPSCSRRGFESASAPTAPPRRLRSTCSTSPVPPLVQPGGEPAVPRRPRRRTRPDPPSVRRHVAAVEATMSFPRPRRHTQSMFVLLALVFGLGFVVFGVGAGGTGIGDILRGHSSSGTKSAKDAQKEIAKHPKQAQGYRDLATAMQADGQTEEP